MVEIIDFSVVTRYRPRTVAGSDGDSIERRGGERAEVGVGVEGLGGVEGKRDEAQGRDKVRELRH